MYFPGGPVAKTALSVQGAEISFLVREVDPHAETKSSHAIAKT